jgi:hypothetical protein
MLVCTALFEDVPVGSSFYSYVRCLACEDIINGYPCGGPFEPCDSANTPYFRPGNPITRGQLAKIVALSANLNGDPGAQLFQDVLPGTSYYRYVNNLARHGVVSGYPCGGPGEQCIPPGNLPYFRPGGNATRGQFAKVVAEAAGLSDDPGPQRFEDVQIGTPFYTYIGRLAARGIISGYLCGVPPAGPCGPLSQSYFLPENNVTRGQASKMVSNTFFPECAVR